LVVDKKRRRRRQRRLDAAMDDVQRRYGPGALSRGGSAGTEGAEEGRAVPHISTGFAALDRAMGIGGLPRGTVCELVGPATAGKTALALKFLAQAQAGGGQVGYIDQALYFDPEQARRCGVDLARLVVGTPHDLAEALAATEVLARSGGLVALVFDAFGFLWTDAQAAAQLATTLHRLPSALARSGTTLLVVHESSEGSSPALAALARYAAVRLRVVRERWLEDHGEVRGYAARVEVLKNRAAPGPLPAAVTTSIEFDAPGQGR
jgi:recombination protein RecA